LIILTTLFMATPAKGKRFVKIVKTVGGRTRKVSYGQAGKASDGGDRIRPGTTRVMLIAQEAWVKCVIFQKQPKTPTRLCVFPENAGNA
jgi:hypothetical protein